MATAKVSRYVVVTQERCDKDYWRSEFFVGVDDPDPATAIFRESNCSPRFGTPEAAAGAALQRGVEFASTLRDPGVIGLLTLHD
ncbi:hypothetical protein [Paraburkholderia sp. BL9I2N2]|uniref:hypothetical protein n=1 Tax=Paraburkholderia sp. BL9I2N2 TaxID=1938809 RepID=UPI00104CEC17|nr:hypothetical protein [Paraburkholderia sp. BL9I2N2]TCK84184.1 hypothetical protein B0G74_9000 [Paraburkholderia sp. BL9I2N2]